MYDLFINYFVNILIKMVFNRQTELNDNDDNARQNKLLVFRRFPNRKLILFGTLKP